MEDKLYSRKKIKIQNFRKMNPIKTLLLIATTTIIIGISLFLRSAYPVFKGSCETAAASKGNKIITEKVRDVMYNYSYDNLIEIKTDDIGNITLIKANTFLINQVVTEIVKSIQEEFDNMPRTTVPINLGSVSGVSILKKFSPSFEIEMESAGNINYSIRTEFESVGINQTHHKIFLKVDARVSILTPIESFSRNIESEVLLTEAVIVGGVPETYYNLEGLENPEDTFNFVE